MKSEAKPSQKKTVFFLGQKPIGERCLEMLVSEFSSQIQVVGVSGNQSDSVWWKNNGIYKISQKHNIPFVPNDTRQNKDLFSLIQKTKPSILISVQHPWIIPGDALRLVDFNAVNLHMAKIPAYRGYYAFNQAILNKESEFTVTLHWMVEEVDAGPIIFEESFPVTNRSTAFDLYRQSIPAGEKAFGRYLENLVQGKSLPKTPLSGPSRFYSKNDLNSQREVKDLKNLEEIDRKARAFYFPPFEPAFVKYGQRHVYVLPENIQAKSSGEEK